MLRDLMVTSKVAVNGYCQADEDMETGKAIIRTSTGFAFPSSETATGLYFVQKARIPVGINAARNEFSDYNTGFVGVDNDDYIVAARYGNPDIFCSDAVGTTFPRTGFVVAANTDGDLVNAAVSSRYRCLGKVTENEHEMIKVEVLDVAQTNPTAYTITVTAPTNGTVSLIGATPYVEGDVITIVPSPSTGYEVDAITVVDGAAASVTVTNSTFEMPGSNATVTVTFKTEA